jgi:glycerol uptake facilitator-like aquaporin
VDLRLTGGPDKLLLPHSFQIAGIIITAVGIVMTYLRFGLGFIPKYLEIQVFAIYSSFFETRYFSVIYNNIIEEICGILLLAGILFITTAKEKKESQELNGFRLKSFLLSVYLTAFFLVLSFILVYGFGFVKILMINIYLSLIFYNILFRYFLFLHRKAGGS